MSANGNFTVYGRMAALPGHRDELVAALLAELRASSGGGLLTYSINTKLDDPDSIWLTRLWIDKQSHDATTRSEPVAPASHRIAPLLARPAEGCHGIAVHLWQRAGDDPQARVTTVDIRPRAPPA